MRTYVGAERRPEALLLGRRGRLRLVKAVHTATWAVFAGSIAVLPVAAWRGAFGLAAALAALVIGEVIGLVYALAAWLARHP